MSDRTFEERYQENDIPWDRSIPDGNLIRIIQEFDIAACRVLDLGCGTGINAVWLQQQGFDVTGVDLSATAIQKAKERAEDQQAGITLFSGNFLKVEVAPGPFDFIFDRGCFHCFDGTEDRTSGVQRIAERLTDDGLWLSLIGNSDDKPREVGPPTMTAAEITKLIEPCFEIISLTSGYFGGEQNDPPKAWICLMKKRTVLE